MIYWFQFPISDYYNEEICKKHVFVESDECPTEEEMIVLLTRLSEKEKEEADKHYSITDEYGSCLIAIKQLTTEFPQIELNLIETNGFCETFRGQRPLVVKLLQVEKK